MAERVPEGTNGQSTQTSKAFEYPKNALAEGNILRVENVIVVPDPTSMMLQTMMQMQMISMMMQMMKKMQFFAEFVALTVLPAVILVTSTAVSSSEDTGVGAHVSAKLGKHLKLF